MASPFGAIVLEMSANVARLQSDLGRAAQLVDRNSAQMTESYARFGLAAGAAVSTVLLGLGDFVRRTIDTRAQLNNMSVTLGDNVQMLDGLRRQAEISGVGMEGLTGSLSRLARNLNSMDDDGRAAATAIKAMGLNVEEMKHKKPAEAFLEIAKALNQFEDGAEKVAALQALMGRGAQTLLPYMKDLANAQDLQGRITKEQAEEAEKLQKQWRALLLSFEDSKVVIGNIVIPYLSKMLEQLAEGTRIAGGFRNAIALFGTMNPFGTAADNVKKLRAELDDYEKSRDRLRAAGPTVDTAWLDRLIDETKKRIAFANVLVRQDILSDPTMGDTPGERARMAASVRRLDYTGPKSQSAQKDALQQLIDNLDQELLRVGDLSKAELVLKMLEEDRFKNFSQQQKNIAIGIASQIDMERSLEIARKDQLKLEEDITEAERQRVIAMNRATDALKDQIEPGRIRERQIEEMIKLFNAGRISIEELNKASMDPDLRELLYPRKTPMEKLNDALKEGDISLEQYLEVVERINGEQKETNDVARDLGMTFASAFEDAIINGKELRDVFKGLAQDLARIAVRKMFTEPIAEAVTEWFKARGIGAGGGGGGSNIWGTAITAIASWFGGSAGGGSFAAGGYVTGGEPILVGERGPELFMPNTSGAIIPNHQLGGGQVFNVDMRGASVEAVARLEKFVYQINATLEPRAINAVADDKRRR
jgi:hypothetical protein